MQTAKPEACDAFCKDWIVMDAYSLSPYSEVPQHTRVKLEAGHFTVFADRPSAFDAACPAPRTAALHLDDCREDVLDTDFLGFGMAGQGSAEQEEGKEAGHLRFSQTRVAPNPKRKANP